MTKKEGKEYQQNGKTIKIIPMKKEKKIKEDNGSGTTAKVKRVKKVEEDGSPRFAIGDKVILKNIPTEYSGFGFGESIVSKVFKSTHDQTYRYSIKSNSGKELSMLTADQLKSRATYK